MILFKKNLVIGMLDYPEEDSGKENIIMTKFLLIKLFMNVF